jgi:hypothetical protein
MPQCAIFFSLLQFSTSAIDMEDARCADGMTHLPPPFPRRRPGGGVPPVDGFFIPLILLSRPPHVYMLLRVRFACVLGHVCRNRPYVRAAAVELPPRSD